MTRPARIMAVASAGGHWVQLQRLSAAWEGCAVTYVTTDPGLERVLPPPASGMPPVRFRTVTEANRWKKRKLVRQMLEMAWIVLRTRPPRFR